MGHLVYTDTDLVYTKIMVDTEKYFKQSCMVWRGI